MRVACALVIVTLILVGCRATPPATDDPRDDEPRVEEPTGQGSRIVATSDTSFLLTGAGQSGKVSAVVVNADGDVDEGASVEWEVHPSDVVDLSADGTFVSRKEVGYATLTARFSTLDPVIVSIAIARPMERTRLVPAVHVLHIADDRLSARLAEADVTRGLAAGDVVVSNAGILGRVTRVQAVDGGLEIVLAPVSLADAFSAIDMSGVAALADGRSPPVPTGSSDEMAPVQPSLALSDLDCRDKQGRALRGPEVIDFSHFELKLVGNPLVRFDYRVALGKIEQFEIVLQDAATVSMAVGNVTLSAQAAAGFRCATTITERSVPLMTFWGLLTLTGDVKLEAGVAGEVRSSLLSVSFSGPSVTTQLTWEAGFTYDRALDGLDGVFSLETSDDPANWSWASFAGTPPSADVQIELGPFVAVKLGVGGKALGVIDVAGSDVISSTVSLGAVLTMPVTDSLDRRYASPQVALRARARMAIAFEAKGQLTRLFDVLKLRTGIKIAQFTPVDLTIALFEPLRLSLDRGVLHPDRFVFRVEPAGSGAIYAHGAVQIVLFRDGQSKGNVVASGTLDQHGSAAISWVADEGDHGSYEALALVVPRLLSSLGLPLRTEGLLTFEARRPQEAPVVTGFDYEPRPAPVGKAVTFSATAEVVAGEGRVSGCSFDPGDGSAVTTHYGRGVSVDCANVTFIHTYADDGVYTARYSAYGGDCGRICDGSTISMTVAVDPYLRDLRPAASHARRGQPMEFAWTAGTHSRTAVTCTFDPGDGTGSRIVPCTGPAQHVYEQIGYYGATVTARTSSGGERSLTVGVEVRAEREVSSCGSWFLSRSGGQGTTDEMWDISRVPLNAAFDVEWQFFTIPDQLTVYYPTSRQVFTTSMVSGGGSFTTMFRKGSSNTFRAIVSAPLANTQWEYRIRCRT